MAVLSRDAPVSGNTVYMAVIVCGAASSSDAQSNSTLLSIPPSGTQIIEMQIVATNVVNCYKDNSKTIREQAKTYQQRYAHIWIHHQCHHLRATKNRRRNV